MRVSGRGVVVAVGMLLIAASGTGVVALDADGVGPLKEWTHGTDAFDPDTDDDGLDDGTEFEGPTHPTIDDTDGDGLFDGQEVANGTDPTEADTDGDGLDDGDERDGSTDPLADDTDDDGLGDRTEVNGDTKPWVPDTDGDGLLDGREVDLGTDPNDPHSDTDRAPDGWEVANGSDPTTAHSDGDGINDSRELQRGMDPTSIDSDDDGLPDALEIRRETSAARADTDGDGLNDSEERAHRADPTDPDSDGDGLDDGREVEIGTKPWAVDSDGDGLPDGAEVGYPTLNGSDPTRMDVWVEVDVLASASLNRAALETVRERFAAHNISVHFVLDDTDLPGATPTRFENRAGDHNDVGDYLNGSFRRRGQGYHYLLVVEAVTSEEGDALPGVLLGQAGPGLMVVQTRAVSSQAAVIMHELGHSVGLTSDVFAGIDNRRYAFSEYRSAMNYNAPDDYVGYSSGPPFDEWAWLRRNLYTPETFQIEPAS